MTSLKINDLAPNFNLNISTAKKISLQDLKGKYLILYFYPKDNTPGCTIEAKNFNDLKDAFHGCGAVIIGVSKDNLKSHQRFKEKYCLKFDLAMDDANVCEQYGVWGERSMFGIKYMGIARTTFLIGKDGHILHIWENVSVNNHAAEVLKLIKSLESTNDSN